MSAAPKDDLATVLMKAIDLAFTDEIENCDEWDDPKYAGKSYIHDGWLDRAVLVAAIRKAVITPLQSEVERLGAESLVLGKSLVKADPENYAHPISGNTCFCGQLYCGNFMP